jgi:hypothetical protein
MRAALLAAGLAVLLGGSASVATEVHWTAAHYLAPQDASTSFSAGDLDGDMDYDLSFLGANPVRQYWNTGTPQSPEWLLDTGQFLNVPYCSHRAGTLGDLDQDGDLDLVVGCMDELLRCYWNTGSQHVPAWQYDPAVFESIAIVPGPTQPYAGDLDNDGDLDLIVVVTYGYLQLVENTGSSVVPEWTYVGFMDGVQIGPGGRSLAALGDLDGDDDLDLVGISWDTPPQCWENVGTPESWDFVENPAMLTGIEPFPGGYGIDLFDVDADGDLDLMVSGWPDSYCYLNEDYVPVEQSTWAAIKAMFQ